MSKHKTPVARDDSGEIHATLSPDLINNSDLLQSLIHRQIAVTLGLLAMAQLERKRRIAKSIDPGERRLGKLMVDALDETLDNLKNANFVKTELKEGVGALQQARGLWRRGKILETISEAAEKAQLANQPTGQAVQARLRTLLGNKKFKRSLLKEEKDLLTQIVKSPADRVLAILGQLRTQIGAVSVGAAAGGLTESVTTGGAVALGMAATGSGARGLRNVLAQQRLKDATRAIAGQKRLPKAPGAEPVAGAAGAAGAVTIERELIDVQE